jgi:gamma-glutamylcyclotransferase (GGCT)/AIG2-like uncharacterized protein YtfP
MKRWYFGYGMNTNLDGMRQRCPKAICHGAAVLSNHKFVFRYHADIEECPGSQVHGVLWSITEDCERSLDMLEGYPYYYNKKEVIIESTHPLMNKFVAMVYFMNDQNGVKLPSDLYLNSLLEGYKENSVDTSQIYNALKLCRANEKTC